MKQTLGPTLKQLELLSPLPPQRRKVTVALNCLACSGHESRVAVVVDTRDLPTTLETLKYVMDFSFVNPLRLSDSSLWFVQHPQCVVIGGFPGTIAHPNKMALLAGGIGYIDTQGNKATWSYKLLSSQCQFWERWVANCQTCNRTSAFDCLQVQLLAAGVSLPTTAEKAAFSLDRVYEKDIPKVLRRILLHSPCEFVPPRHTSQNPFSNFLREVDDIDFGLVEENRRREQERGKAAAATKRCLKRCREECFFVEYCPYILGRERSASHWCQTNPWGDTDMPKGPFSKAEIEATKREVLEQITPQHRKVIGFFAQNGGAATRIFGYWLELGKMDPTLQFVEWHEPKGHRKMRFSIEDSLYLLRTPFRQRKRYYRPRTWTRPQQLDDDTLFLYIELCQNNEYRIEKRRWFFRWYDRAPAATVELESDNKSFSVLDDRENPIGVFRNYGHIFAQKGNELPQLLLNHLRGIKPQMGSVETVLPESS